MELDKIKWNNKRYKEFIKYLKSLGNLKDKNFNEKYSHKEIIDILTSQYLAGYIIFNNDIIININR